MAYNPMPTVPDRSFNSPVDSLLNGTTQQQTRQQQLDALRKQGYDIQGDQAVTYQNYGQGGRAIPSYTPIDSLLGGVQGQRMPGDPLLRGALQSDTHNMQQAADRQFARNNQMITGMEGFIGNAGQEMRQAGQQGAAQLNGAAAGAQRMGQQQLDDMGNLLGGYQDQTNKAVDGINKGVTDVQNRIKGTMDKQMPGYYQGLDDAKGDVNAAYKLGDEAVAGYQKAISEFKDTTAADASVAAAAMRRSALSQKNALTTALKTGQIDDATYQSNLQQLQGQVGEQVQGQVQGLYTEFNKAKAGMEQALAGLRMNNAGNRLTGAQIKGGLEGQRLQGVGMELNANEALLQGENTKLGAAGLQQKNNMDIASQYANAQAGQRQMAQLSASLQSSSVATQQAAIMNAVNLEMQGRTTMAQLVQQNPETVVSWFQGILAMYSADAARSGSQGFGGGGGAVSTPSAAAQGTGQQRAQAQQGPAQFGQAGYQNPNSNYAPSTGAFNNNSVGARPTGSNANQNFTGQMSNNQAFT